MKKEEKTYIDCSRCGEQMQVTGGGPERVQYYVEYKNAVLCLRCAEKRAFDDDNPVLYP